MTLRSDIAGVRAAPTVLAMCDLCHFLCDENKTLAAVRPLLPQGKNVLEVDRGDWKLIDLDAAARFGTVMQMAKVSSAYAPPEAARRLVGESKADLEPLRASASFDVWGWGVVLFELCTGAQLFRKDINDDILPSDYSRLLLWVDVSTHELASVFAAAVGSSNGAVAAAARDLIRACLAGDPEQRPSFAKILSHAFITGAWRKLGPQRTPGMRYHFFISHMQKEASGEVGLLFFQFETIGIHCWRDMV